MDSRSEDNVQNFRRREDRRLRWRFSILMVIALIFNLLTFASPLVMGSHNVSIVQTIFGGVSLVAILGALFEYVSGLWKLDSRQRRGLCERCGYDVRYSPKRCPECGLLRQSDVSSGSSD